MYRIVIGRNLRGKTLGIVGPAGSARRLRKWPRPLK